jgi:hypothetical protein
MLHVMLPVQYLRRADAGLATPQRRLMLAVLQTVLDDCQGTAYARATGVDGKRDDRALRQAVAYLESRDRSWPYSFDNICEAIGLDADSIRRTLLRRIAPIAD